MKLDYPLLQDSISLITLPTGMTRPPVRGLPAHDGTAVLIHRRIVHQPIILNTALQTSSALIQLNGQDILISVVYKPPGAILTTNDLDLLTQSAEWQISAGDFNAIHPIWYSHSTNTAGLVLFDHVQQSHYVITALTSPTYYPTNARYRPDILDIMSLCNYAITLLDTN